MAASLLRSLALAFVLGVTASCSGTPEAEPNPAPVPADVAPEAVKQDLTIPTVALKFDDTAGDKSVPAEMGGPGFTGEGWITATQASALGDPTAPQGGELVKPELDWPVTLRMAGKDWNSAINYAVNDLCFETLLNMDPVTQQYQPRLATHWQISDDKTTYRFRIDPRARWSDGEEVTAADVVATWKLQTDPTLLEPSGVLTYGKFEQPKAISKYIVEVKTKEENWRNFMYFAASMSIFPAHQISTGTKYLKDFQWTLTAHTGPYTINPEDVKTGESITLTRRTDWWAEDQPQYDGWFNIARIKYVVVKDTNLMFEKLKKGELDYMFIQRAAWWAEDMPKAEPVQKGWLVQQKFFNDAPIGVQGIALQEQHPPLDDKRIRLALQYLFDRKTMIKKLFYDEYRPLDSYYPGGVYANPNNENIGYDEVKAVDLLEQAGWKDIDKDGYRTKDGKELVLKLTYDDQSEEKYLTVFQEACKRAGIKLDFELLTPAASWKNRTQKEFELVMAAWGGLVFPNPETSYSTALATQKDNNNITGFSNAKVDELLGAYDREYDPAKRAQLIREIDGLIYDDHPYVLAWYSGSQRVGYWNKFGMPAWGVPRFLDRDEMFFVWWVDPAKEKALADARANGTALPLPASKENHFWEDWDKAQLSASTDGAAEQEPTPEPADETPAPK